MRDVARALVNTPAVRRSSYVDPRVVTAYREGRTIAAALKRAQRLDSEQAQHVLEKAVCRLLGRRS
ncbi:hypothetical protein ACFWY9_18965 [Amycolatopsis sp. NPDC059027]|uniref:hypothetical protein n=1 Tax=Amycolatopsis sp. NPDC059027 TaxID=3346709 RepID=UPI00366C8403